MPKGNRVSHSRKNSLYQSTIPYSPTYHAWQLAMYNLAEFRARARRFVPPFKKSGKMKMPVSRATFQRLLSAIKDANPQSRVDIQKIFPTWYAIFRDHDEDVVKEGVRQVIMSCKFFPTIAELMASVKEVEAARAIKLKAARQAAAIALNDHLAQAEADPDEVKTLIHQIISSLEAKMDMNHAGRHRWADSQVDVAKDESGTWAMSRRIAGYA